MPAPGYQPAALAMYTFSHGPITSTLARFSAGEALSRTSETLPSKRVPSDSTASFGVQLQGLNQHVCGPGKHSQMSFATKKKQGYLYRFPTLPSPCYSHHIFFAYWRNQALQKGPNDSRRHDAHKSLTPPSSVSCRFPNPHTVADQTPPTSLRPGLLVTAWPQAQEAGANSLLTRPS